MYYFRLLFCSGRAEDETKALEGTTGQNDRSQTKKRVTADRQEEGKKEL